MKRAEERNKFLSPRVIHRKPERGLDGLGAAVCEMCLGWPVDRTDLTQLLPELRHVAVIEIGAAEMNETVDLLSHGFDDLGMAVAGRAYGNAGVAVEKDVVVRIRDPNAAGV